ncbi:E3 ubiquitin-protein ligase MARCHF6 [Harmonia axyridis]|uniref:E3 ubiquitin-protein ligase MARCHF6 n=1 Tax=Harmonia axyridis TaxID=115357 RepID=UPI001E279BFD|nr:E3 ubiquitin-protein ligase MARCHF6 [Harmonia axyridis]XP_045477855.1 E3 ubiquitin-protein ligase MARCHF6 [Harmonia axyridis]
MDSELSNIDICRVCRSEGLPDRPLFHPCICTGSIKWIHQECLTQWMKYSHKEYCELCGYRFSFTPIYSPDMPRRLPLKDLVSGLLSSILTTVKYWFHYTLVAVAWTGIVPLTACRIYRALFKGSIDGILSLPFDMLSTENLTSDTFQGCFVVICTLFAFAGLVWLREQIIHGGGPEWMQREDDDVRVRLAPLNNNEAEPLALVPEQNIAEPEPVAVAPENPEFPEDAEMNANEDNNWIPMEWDRAAEEITWERLLGLDGSLKFIEHVFWVISLNTLFIIIFAYSPYHMGLWTLHISNMTEYASASHFEGLLTTLVGYCSVGFLFLFFHRIAHFLGFQKAKRVLALGYIVVKVSLLSVLEIGVLPLVCGWWLDICSLSMFDATLKDRESSFSAAPGTSVFIHWLIGMVYVYYFASFVLLLREILRPGVLWFLKNFNDPDFSPVQEMIHLPILQHIRKLLISAVIFGSAVLLMLWLPIRIIKWLLPNFLPYSVYLNNETQVNELSLELMLLQVILPALLEQSHTRIWLKGLVRNWCRAVSWILGIHSYLLGESDGVVNRDQNNEQNNPNQQDGGLGAAHQALFMMEPPTGFQPYTKPSFFMGRLVGLLISVCISLVIASVFALTVPVWLGRKVMALWLAGGPTVVTLIAKNTPQEQLNEVKVHELYTAACGLYVGWLTARAISLVLSWLPQGRAAMIERLKQWCVLGLKTVVASFLLLWVIPLLFGLLFELVVIVPLRVPIHQTPILFIWQDWALGVLYTKIACAVTMMGPEWFLRNAIEQAYRDGIRQMQLRLIIENLALPVIVCFGLALSVPYVIAHSIVPLFVSSFQLRNLIARKIYPFLLLMIFLLVFISFQIRQFKNLYEHIKNDKYLVGQRLVNYNHRKKRDSTT